MLYHSNAFNLQEKSMYASYSELTPNFKSGKYTFHFARECRQIGEAERKESVTLGERACVCGAKGGGGVW